MKFRIRLLFFSVCSGLLVKPVEATWSDYTTKCREYTSMIAETCRGCTSQITSSQLWRDYTSKITPKHLCIASFALSACGYLLYSRTKAQKIRKNSLIRADIATIAEMIKNPDKYTVGAALPRGILLVGVSGAEIARAVADEESFFFARTEYCNAAAISNLFIAARERAQELSKKRGKPSKSVIFIDGIDVLNYQFKFNYTFCAQERFDKIYLELCYQLENLDSLNSSILVIAAAKSLERLPFSITQSGRLDHILYMETPDKETRASIFRLFAEKVRHEQLDFNQLASKTEGMGTADIQNLVNQAAIRAAHKGAPALTQKHFEKIFLKR